MPPLGEFPSEYCYAIWHGKTIMVWLHYGEKILICLFILTQSTNVINTHTHTQRERQTETPHDGIGRAYAYHKSISCKQHSSNLYHKELLALLLNPGPCTSRLKVLRKSTYLPFSSSSSTTTTSSSLSECFTGAQ